MSGLIAMGNIGFYNSDRGAPTFTLAEMVTYPGTVSDTMLDVTWAQPEPSSGRLDTRAIDSALGTVRAWNTAHSTSRLDIKLRT